MSSSEWVAFECGWPGESDVLRNSMPSRMALSTFPWSWPRAREPRMRTETDVTKAFIDPLQIRTQDTGSQFSGGRPAVVLLGDRLRRWRVPPCRRTPKCEPLRRSVWREGLLPGDR